VSVNGIHITESATVEQVSGMMLGPPGGIVELHLKAEEEVTRPDWTFRRMGEDEGEDTLHQKHWRGAGGQMKQDYAPPRPREGGFRARACDQNVKLL
jgi:hypothetical protein